ncbi:MULTISPECIES: S9 family peptidase [Flavobacteriaceae]|uniref:S9 family peptidase n=2 Tax=Flavobacteriaceae TaxID=49546 RepID=A0A4Y8AVW7_9FLAO|nr:MULTISPECIES: S9 family peptidase [Flavobacteriaceae]TEW75496.1 S9 family peptidase [Gramella jeungdoensis]GGK45677.1 peptidase [Lutibacter litoralis]
MKKIIYYLLPILLIACNTEPKEADNSVQNLKEYSINQFMDNESVNGGSFSTDKSKLLVTSNRTGVYNMYTVSTKTGEFIPESKSDSSSVFSISYFPNDDRILFRMDDNGNELNHIYMKDSTGITDLTPYEGSNSSFYGWAKNKESFFFGSNKRDKRFFDVYEMNISTFKPTLLFENLEGYNFNGISNNKKYLALSKTVNTSDSDLFIYNFEDKSFTKINEIQSSNAAADFSVDSKHLFYTTDVDSEFTYLMKYDIETKTREKVLEKPWDITSSYFSENGKYQITSINEDAKTKVFINDTETGNDIELPTFDNGSVIGVGFSRDETNIRFYVGGSNSPYNLYVYDIATKKAKKLTDVLNKEIDPTHMVNSEVIRFKSFDGVEIPAIYYKPHQATKNNKVPALVMVHGGPGGQSGQYYNPLVQYLVNHGYAILAVNNRGSSGYGKTFYQMDDLNHGDKDLKDCIEGKNWLADQEIIDGGSIGIMGGSYGGYMTMAALTFTPEEFDVGVNLFGVTNWLRTLKSIPPYWESFREALYKELGDPYSADSVRLRKISPLFHAESITKPLIVLQGTMDPRVLKIESDEIVAAAKKNDVPVEYVLFEDEGHGFVKKENQITAYGNILKFLDTYLKKSEIPVKQ